MQINRYPSVSTSALRSALVVHYQINKAQIICGNGSEEILHLLVKAYAGPDDEIIYPQYGFLVYRAATLSAGVTPIPVSQPSLRLDMEAVLAAVTPRTKIIFIDNPANPLGSYVSSSELGYLREQLPNYGILVLDGAYADFIDDVVDYSAGLEWVNDSDNVAEIVHAVVHFLGQAGIIVRPLDAYNLAAYLCITLGIP